MADNKTRQDKGAHPRRIRSFVLRTGRVTPGQRRALAELWPRYGIDCTDGLIDTAAVFGRQAATTVEIGFGNGENLIAMAASHAEQNFLGIEVHEAGVGHCLLEAMQQDLDNVRVLRADAVEILRHNIADASLSRINLFFPDPWHKKRHHKRRIVQPDFVALMAQKLESGGIFHVATDWPDYAEHIQAVMDEAGAFEAAQQIPADRIETRFDKRGQRLGHSNWEGAWCTRSNA